ncbi:hypothetical protein EJ06DRAFT_523794 [Trichodelitschia bisporula]|uniref:C2H2-type domain-containing protein n=1 Tax=Trichodelitschia bisporula TaxID=703511 RepID=A0A6G1HQ96_9PEZI|nr:hypothetical protein EJ06DRAFT_523794 [Trichodelitschia bisporula]
MWSDSIPTEGTPQDSGDYHDWYYEPSYETNTASAAPYGYQYNYYVQMNQMNRMNQMYPMYPPAPVPQRPLSVNSAAAYSATASSCAHPPSSYTELTSPSRLSPQRTVSPTYPEVYAPESQEMPSPQMSPVSQPATDRSDSVPRSHPYYQAGPSSDGFYHCPFAAAEGCGHEPKVLKCEYDKYVDSHLKPFRCKHKDCYELQFSSTACLLRHEREAHDMHGHEESLCEFPPCSRSVPGQGFRRSYNCRDHMSRCHDYVEAPSDKKRRGVSQSAKAVTRKGRSPGRGQQVRRLQAQLDEHHANLDVMNRKIQEGKKLSSSQLQGMQRDIQKIMEVNRQLEELQQSMG